MYSRTICDNFIDIKDEKNNVVFTIKEELSGDSLTVGLAGDIQAQAVYEFEDEILAVLSACKSSVCSNPTCNRIVIKKLVFDLSRVNYISSVALRSFLKFQGIIDGFDDFALSIVNPSAPVLEKLKETGYMDILDIKIEDVEAGK